MISIRYRSGGLRVRQAASPLNAALWRLRRRGPEFWGEVQPPGVTEGARYSFSPSRLCPLETEQKAGVRNGKPDFSLRNQCCRRGCTSLRNPPGPAAGDAVPAFRHVRAAEAIAGDCWVGSDGRRGATPHHRQTAEDSSLTLSISMQPTPSKTRLAQSSHDRLASTHDVPEQARPVVFDHQNDRPLVDAEVIGADPPSRGTVFDHVGLIERGFEPIKTLHAEVHSPEVSDRRNDDLGRERQ